MTQQKDGKFGQYMALTAALLGWLFDGFEIGLFPMTGKPALKELLGNAVAGVGNAVTSEQAAAIAKDADAWFGVIIAVFLVGAATGGVLFGWLGDRIGRVRAMSMSILAYALFTGLCGLAEQPWHIAVLRFMASLGMGGEWSLGVALVNEIWPGKSRAFIAGLIGAAANVGFALVGFMGLWLSTVVGTLRSTFEALGLSPEFSASLFANDGWRFLMMSGALPALLVFFVRVFVPESHKWEEGNAKGTTSFWSNSDLIGVAVGCLGAVLIIYVWTPDVGAALLRFTMGESSTLGIEDSKTANRVVLLLQLIPTVFGFVVALLGYLFPVRQFIARSNASGTLQQENSKKVIRTMLFGAALAGVALLGTWGSVQRAPQWAGELGKASGVTPAITPAIATAWTQIWLSAGAIVGTIVAAVAADYLGRRLTYALICILSMLSCVAMFQLNDSFDTKFQFYAFLMGGTTAAMYGFFPLYFPELFPTSMRATGQGFCFNFGRVIAAVGGLQTATLISAFGGSFPKAGTVMSAIYLIGAVLIWFGPETKGKPLPE